MSNRTYTTLFIVFGVALAVVIAISYFTHRLALSQTSLLLLSVLVVLPAGAFLRFLPMQLMADSMPSEFRDEIIANRRANSQSPRAVWFAVASILASYAVVALVVTIDPIVDSTVFNLLALAWLGLFFFGFMGLIYTSRWIQTHSALFAIIGIVLVLGSAAILFFMFGMFRPSYLFLFPAVIFLNGLEMMITPLIVGMARSWGQID